MKTENLKITLLQRTVLKRFKKLYTSDKILKISNFSSRKACELMKKETISPNLSSLIRIFFYLNHSRPLFQNCCMVRLLFDQLVSSEDTKPLAISETLSEDSSQLLSCKPLRRNFCKADFFMARLTYIILDLLSCPQKYGQMKESYVLEKIHLMQSSKNYLRTS